MRRLESELQRAIVTYLRAKRIPVWSTPNGGARRKVDAAILKAEGALAGVPDLFCIPVFGLVVGLEVKSPQKILLSGRPSTARPRLSQAQGEVMTWLTQHGVPCHVVRSIDDVAAIIERETQNAKRGALGRER